ncbi:MAG: GNAT family N-acetyltransferase [Phycisphaeraceae bacterium]
MQTPIQDSPIIRLVTPQAVRTLRHRVLRPHQTLDTMVYPGDDEVTTFHLAAITTANEIVAIASFYIAAHPIDPAPHDWQLRGMAVDPVWQGTGLGTRLMQHATHHLAGKAGRRLWCNARLSAQHFYEKVGFTAQGDIFEIEPIGPHTVMSIDLM